MTKQEIYMLAGGAVIVAFLFSNKGAKSFGQDVGAGAVNLVDGVLSGGVIAIGEIVGVPATDKSKGQQEFDAGDWWSASFDLPAGDFIGNVWKSVTGK